MDTTRDTLARLQLQLEEQEALIVAITRRLAKAEREIKRHGGRVTRLMDRKREGMKIPRSHAERMEFIRGRMSR